MRPCLGFFVFVAVAEVSGTMDDGNATLVSDSTSSVAVVAGVPPTLVSTPAVSVDQAAEADGHTGDLPLDDRRLQVKAGSQGMYDLSNLTNWNTAAYTNYSELPKSTVLKTVTTSSMQLGGTGMAMHLLFGGEEEDGSHFFRNKAGREAVRTASTLFTMFILVAGLIGLILPVLCSDKKQNQAAFSVHIDRHAASMCARGVERRMRAEARAITNSTVSIPDAANDITTLRRDAENAAGKAAGKAAGTAWKVRKVVTKRATGAKRASKMEQSGSISDGLPDHVGRAVALVHASCEEDDISSKPRAA